MENNDTLEVIQRIFDKPPLLLICGGTEDNYILKRINVFDE